MDLPDCPPGTEGYQDSTFEAPKNKDFSTTKAETEFFEHIKSLKIQTEEGVRCLADRQARDVGGQYVYLCFPCGVQCAGETVMQTHLIGKKHKTKLSLMKVWPMTIFTEHPYFEKAAKAPKEALQGNDLNERYKSFRERTCAIQSVLDEVKAPMIGVEYLVEFPSDDGKSNTYMCTLCHTHGHPRTIIDHYTSFRHRLTYFRIHFSKAIQLLGPYNHHRRYHEGVGVVVHRLALRIEDKFGRQRPLCIEKEIFDSEKDKICQWIIKGYHFSENEGSTFEEVIDINLITSLDNGDKLNNIKNERDELTKRDPSPPVVNAPKRPKQMTDQSGSHDRLSDNSNAERESRRPFSAYRGRPSPYVRSSRHSPYRDDRKVSPTRYLYSTKKQDVKKKEDHKLEFKQKMAADKTLAAEEAAKKILAYHEKNPEKHPLYPEEWKKFWNKRYKELQAEGKDAAKHDFKPEWIVYWTKRMKELHDEELRQNITEIYRKFGFEPPSKHKEPSHRSPEPRRRSPEPRRHSPEPRRRSPEPRRRSPELRRYSPEPRLRSPELRRRSPEPRRRSPDLRRRSPDARRRTRWSPESRRRSPDVRRSSQETRRRSPQPPRRSPNPSRLSPFMRNRSPIATMNRDKPMPVKARSRSPIKTKNPVFNPRIELQSLNMRSQSPLSRRDAHRNRSPQPAPVASATVIISDEEFKPEDDGLSLLSDQSLDSLGSLPDVGSPVHRPRSQTNSTVSRSSYRPHSMRSGPRHAKNVAEHAAVKMGDPSDEVVPTLRLLVALEDHLGSLGPKIVELLTDALKMEKKKPNSSEELLDREAAVVLLETAKEKLKGVTQAGLVGLAAAGALRSAVVRIAALLHEADTRAARARDKKKAAEAAGGVGEAVRVAGVGAVDKAEIAAQMAAALVAQGKTDVSAEELAQLVDAVVGMAEAKRREAEASKRAAGTGPSPAPAADRSPIASALQLLQSAYDDNEKKNEMDAAAVASAPASVLVSKPAWVVAAALDPAPDPAAADPIDGLSDSDLETLLKNFNELSAEEQHSLIAYLKKLEAKDPRRVERLREYVDAAAVNAPPPAPPQLDDPTEPDPPVALAANPSPPAHSSSPPAHSSSPPAARPPAPVAPKKSDVIRKDTPTSQPAVVNIDSDDDDDDYTVEEVVKSANLKEVENAKKIETPKDAHKNIPNINLSSANNLSTHSDLLAIVRAAVEAKAQPDAPTPTTVNTKPISFGDGQQIPSLQPSPRAVPGPVPGAPPQNAWRPAPAPAAMGPPDAPWQRAPAAGPGPTGPPAVVWQAAPSGDPWRHAPPQQFPPSQRLPAPNQPLHRQPQQPEFDEFGNSSYPPMANDPRPQWNPNVQHQQQQQWAGPGSQAPPPRFDQGPNVYHNNAGPPLMNGRPQMPMRQRAPAPFRQGRPDVNYGYNNYGNAGRGRGRGY